jgi:hypothetical protein
LFRIPILPTAQCLLLLIGVPAFAQIDFSGEWQDLYHEDQMERIPGPSVGDYLGIPINEGARLRGDSWQASMLTLPERQCVPHPAVYGLWGPANLRISKVTDPITQDVQAFIVFGTFGHATRTIWLDGRPHPPEYAAHTWAGFSTGTWDGDMLTVKTTHIKSGYIRRNGILTSDRATVTEHYLRHENTLTIVFIREDPDNLTEPYIQTVNWVLNPAQKINENKCEPATEIAGRAKGYVPHNLPGENQQIKEFSEQFGIPYQAARGGGETMYPEYRKKLKTMAIPKKVAVQ